MELRKAQAAVQCLATYFQQQRISLQPSNFEWEKDNLSEPILLFHVELRGWEMNKRPISCYSTIDPHYLQNNLDATLQTLFGLRRHQILETETLVSSIADIKTNAISKMQQLLKTTSSRFTVDIDPKEAARLLIQHVNGPATRLRQLNTKKRKIPLNSCPLDFLVATSKNVTIPLEAGEETFETCLPHDILAQVLQAAA